MWLKATARLAPQTDRCHIPYRTPNRSGRQEPMVSRIYVEKKPGFDVEAQQLKGELTEILGIKGIEALRIINRYDVEGIDEELFRSCVPTVFSEPQVDVTYDELPASDGAVFAVEFLPGQFDQRADSASECVQLISQGERPVVRSAKVYIISGALDEAAIEAIKAFLNTNTPVFGICLGHQLLGLASGAKTVKMKFGHHGANHPVKSRDDNTVMITAQNHGFAVDENSLPDCLRATHVSLFDGSLQGIHRTDRPAFSFQGHPEASPGPHDCAGLFDHFIELIKQYRA